MVSMKIDKRNYFVNVHVCQNLCFYIQRLVPGTFRDGFTAGRKYLLLDSITPFNAVRTVQKNSYRWRRINFIIISKKLQNCYCFRAIDRYFQLNGNYRRGPETSRDTKTIISVVDIDEWRSFINAPRRAASL